jgi:hypothetical protein
MHIHQETERWPGPDVVIDCPACHERGVSATTYDQRTQERLYGLIRLNDVRSTWVTCTGCGAVLRSRVPAAELEGRTTDDLTDQMYFDAGFLPKALAVMAVFVSVFPIAGTVMAAIALFANRKTPGWWRAISIVALVLSLLILGLIGMLLVAEQLGLLK